MGSALHSNIEKKKKVKKVRAFQITAQTELIAVHKAKQIWQSPRRRDPRYQEMFRANGSVCLAAYLYHRTLALGIPLPGATRLSADGGGT